MEDGLSIDIEFEGKELSFEARLVTTGYTHRIIVLVNGNDITYEPDEERAYRAMVDGAVSGRINERDLEIIRALGECLNGLHF